LKKGFTLLEVLISISIFFILIVFLYKTLDQTKYSNNMFKKKEEVLVGKNKIYKMFLEDILESSTIEIQKDKNKNSVLKMKSTNTFHNPRYSNITYLINNSNSLIRIESKDEFSLDKTSQEFYENIYIDELVKDVQIFNTVNINQNIRVAIKEENKEIYYFNLFLLIME